MNALERTDLKTVFVTGGAGYVGSHCCKAFAEAGWTVVTYDNLSKGWREMVRWGPLVVGDILGRPALQAAMAEHKPDVVAHFAALSSVGESVADPSIYYRNNVTGTWTILEAMRDVGVDKIIFSSTAATYGNPEETPMPETHRQSPINPYGWSKLFVERMLADYASAYGLKFCALRYFNAAGADPEGLIGEKHEPETHVSPLAARGALSDDYRFTVFGDDFDTRDGTCVRDYVHVSDLGSAHALAADHLMAGGAGGFFNLGTGVGTTVKEIADAIEHASGKPLVRAVGPRRAGDPAVLVASNAKAREVLGWEPQRSDIATIVADAFRWHAKEDTSPLAGG
ncbi:UDP-glucose 4-epimerase GalE [soil metagenome]